MVGEYAKTKQSNIITAISNDDGLNKPFMACKATNGRMIFAAKIASGVRVCACSVHLQHARENQTIHAHHFL